MSEDLQARIDALPKRPHPAATSGPTDYYLQMLAFREAQLSLLREWVAEANHHDGCACLYYAASSEMWFASDDKPCTCGRDALLAATKVPR